MSAEAPVSQESSKLIDNIAAGADLYWKYVFGDDDDMSLEINILDRTFYIRRFFGNGYSIDCYPRFATPETLRTRILMVFPDGHSPHEIEISRPSGPNYASGEKINITDLSTHEEELGILKDLKAGFADVLVRRAKDSGNPDFFLGVRSYLGVMSI